MLLSLAPTSLWDVKPLDFLEAAREAGFEGVGLRLSPSPHRASYPVLGNAPLIAEMKSAIASAGFEVLDVFTFYLQPEMDWETIEATISLAAEFRARYLNVNGTDPIWARMRDNFARLCELSGSYGPSPLIEFAPVHALTTLDVALRLIEEGEVTNSGVALDAIHFFRSGGNPADLAKVDMRKLRVLQLTDGVFGPGEPLTHFGPDAGGGERRLPGQGEFRLSELLDAFPPDVALSLEVLPRPAGTSPVEWVKAIALSTREFLAARAASG